MDCKWSVTPQAQHAEDQQRAKPTGQRGFLRFTAKYLQKKIFCIVAAFRTAGQGNQVTAPHPRKPLSCRASAAAPPARRLRKPITRALCRLHHQMPDPTPDPCRFSPVLRTAHPLSHNRRRVRNRQNAASPRRHCPNPALQPSPSLWEFFAFQQGRNRRARVRLIL